MVAEPTCSCTQLGYLAGLLNSKVTANRILADMKFGSQSVQKMLQNEHIPDKVGVVTPSKPAGGESPTTKKPPTSKD